MRSALVLFLALTSLFACEEEGSRATRPFAFCPVGAPVDATPCKTDGLLCFYNAGRLIEECVACADGPCTEQVFECTEGEFAPVDRSNCDGDAGTGDLDADSPEQ